MARQINGNREGLQQKASVAGRLEVSRDVKDVRGYLHDANRNGFTARMPRLRSPFRAWWGRALGTGLGTDSAIFLTAYLTAYPGQSVTLPDTLARKRRIAPNT